MTTQTQDTNAQRRAPSDAPVFGKHSAPAGANQTGSFLDVSRMAHWDMVNDSFGEQHWAGWWVVDLCDADPLFLTHLAEQPRGYAHYLCLIRMALLERGGDANARDDARMLRAGNKRKLLKELFPTCPAALVNLLHKLPKKPMPIEAYQKLICAMEDEKIRKSLFHAERIKEAGIFMLDEMAALPERFRSVAMCCIKNADDFDDLNWDFHWVMVAIEKLGLKITEQELGKVFSRKGGTTAWLEKKISKLPFPDPPWEGDDEIRPIRSLNKLKIAAKMLENCMTSSHLRRHYASRVVTRHSYFYVCDHIPAMVEVRHDDFWGWSVHEIAGATPDQKSEIEMKFFRACISPALGKTPNRFDDFIDDIPF